MNEAGRVEKVALKLPPGSGSARCATRRSTSMLLAGELDAVLSARPPRALRAKARIVRLYPDYREPEEAYFRKTGVFPIMHVVALRRDVFERDPWIAMNLLKAFEEAKRRSLARLADVTASHAPLPWIGDYVARRTRALRRRSVAVRHRSRTGVRSRRSSRFAFEQGVCHRRLAVEELFPEQLATSYKV